MVSIGLSRKEITVETIDLLSGFILPHVIAGTLALLAYWGAALTRKGSKPHRLAGRIHMLSMVAIVITALPLTALTFIQGNVVIAAFLGYLAILVTHNSVVAWRAVRLKRHFDRFANITYKAGAVATGLAGLLVMILGINKGALILIAFGAVGPWAMWGAYRLYSNANRPANWWLVEHIGAMIGNGIAVHIAFLQIGLSRLLRNLDMNTVIQMSWLLPLVVGIVAGIYFSRKFVGPRVPAREV